MSDTAAGLHKHHFTANQYEQYAYFYLKLQLSESVNELEVQSSSFLFVLCLLIGY